MIEITLSDHTADQSSLAAAKRKAEYEAAYGAYARAVAQRKAKGTALRQASREWLQAGKYGAWLISFFPRMAHALSGSPKEPQMAEASRNEMVWNAGGEGEQRVSDSLKQIFSDEWTVVSGYKNRGGEIDKILVGPTGVLAIEIKFVNGRVSCAGDRWWRDKYDKYGNLVQSNVPIADKRGRGPSAQVNDAADRLQEFLHKRGIALRVARAVVLSHSSSSISQFQGQTVDLIATLDQLIASELSSAVTGGLGGGTAQQILTLIKKDHEFNARPPSHGNRHRRQGLL
ncbi:nuclease-like protein [Desulfobotulus alkaliphilus]|uniref:Nuclease-like protein n=1 Tax=Desulfobotulus alkaliphilus TaxID=622671 RepID=A0A562QYU1_9BACT|nr:nuclease-related domain-containing protein [Desulfobotulus alkaliphilus]TWI61743.1 nuclease-like protein [Desulfobotulus alkaliphilus]